MGSFAEVLRRAGARIKELRKARGLNQEELAGRAGLSRTYIGTIELGGKQPSLWTLFRISRALGVAIAEIFLPPSKASPTAREIVARIEAKLLVKDRTVAELHKAEDLLEAFLRKGS